MTDRSKAQDVIEFIQMLRLTGDFYGKPFILLEWQIEVITNVYGTVNEDGSRQYRFAYLEIPKKNGKTELTAALALNHLVNDPPSGQIYCCAAEKQQAGLVYNAACQMIEQNRYLSKILKVIDSKKEIHYKGKSSFIKVLSAEAYSKHGLNPTVIIFDELHAQQNRDLWDTMTFGSGSARKHPLWWVITTAGDDPDHKTIGWEQHEYARRVRDGEITDPYWYVKLYNAPEDADIYDENLWYEVNPSLGITIPIETVRQEALQARNSESVEKLFRWLRLNQWVSLKRLSWLPLTLWDATADDGYLPLLVGKRCYPGVDLSKSTDLTGMVLLFPPQKGLDCWYFLSEGWIPEDNMKERINRDHVPYDRWHKDGYLSVTAGDTVDYNYIEARIRQRCLEYQIRYMGIDAHYSKMLTQRLLYNEKAVEAVEVAQSMAGHTAPMKEIERLLRSGGMKHETNPLARWCFGNVVIATDGNENMKTMKNKSHDRIDLTVALINAMAVALTQEKAPVIYTQRGMRSLM